MSFEVLTIDTQHKSFLKDVSINVSGGRMATCSDDEIKVWDKSGSDGWNLSYEWKEHNKESLLKIIWAPSELGEILATCSSDGSTCIWEEIATGKPHSDQPNMWIRRAKYTYSRGIISDIKFAPSEFGLILTTCSTDGFLRFYNAPDILNTSEWKFQYMINCERICSCITWSDSNDGTNWPLIAVGCEEIVDEADVDVDVDADDDAALTSTIFFYEYQEHRGRYALVDELGTDGPIHSLSFAPTLGRPYRYLAVASRTIVILCIKFLPDCDIRYEITQRIIGDDCTGDIYVVDWNIYGLSCLTSGDDGTVRVWEEFENVWRIVSEIKTKKKSGETVEGTLSDSSEVVTVPANIISQPKPSYVELSSS